MFYDKSGKPKFPKRYIKAIIALMNSDKDPNVSISNFLSGVGAGDIQSQAGEILTMVACALDGEQFDAFYNALTTGKDREWLQQSSLDTWILMEACNESARKNKKILIQELKNTLKESNT